MQKTPFSTKVYEILRMVPRGKVATYGQMAVLAGSPRAARAIGMIMKENSDAPRTPCHRVVASDGTMHGYSGKDGIVGKKRMLLEEGVKFKGDKVDLTVSQWRP